MITDFLQLSEFAKNFKPVLECLAFTAGGLALFKWFSERRDRGTDVLFQLETEFKSKCANARNLIENDAGYDTVKEQLAASAQLIETGQKKHLTRQTEVDELLRFYVLLFAIREARQLSDRPLSICYRYWLAHYYRNDREELRWYVNAMFPTLSKWLLADTHWWSRSLLAKWRRSFFCPAHFWDAKDYSLSVDELSGKPPRTLVQPSS